MKRSHRGLRVPNKTVDRTPGCKEGEASGLLAVTDDRRSRQGLPQVLIGALRGWGLCAVLTWAGCAHQAPQADAPSSASSGGEVATLERRIASAKATIRGGVSRAAASESAPASAAGSGSAPFSRCDGVCQAAEEICTCHRRICALADELKDSRSADSCRRSQRDCEDAGRSCAACGG